MPNTLDHLETQVLEKMYLREIELLKSGLLTGRFGKKIRKHKARAIEIAVAIHKKQEGHDPVLSRSFLSLVQI